MFFDPHLKASYRSTSRRNLSGKKYPSLAANQYIHSLADFQTHIESHILRVQILGRYIFETFPQYFSHVTKTLLKKRLFLHDQSKVNREPSFMDRFYPLAQERPIIADLFEAVYLRRDQPAKIRLQKILQIVEKLNLVDIQLNHRFNKAHHLFTPEGKLSEAGRELDFLEKLADSIDRRLDPVSSEEFNRNQRLQPHYFSSKIALEILKHMEAFDPQMAQERYFTITTGYSFNAQKRLTILRACLGPASQLPY